MLDSFDRPAVEQSPEPSGGAAGGNAQVPRELKTVMRVQNKALHHWCSEALKHLNITASGGKHTDRCFTSTHRSTEMQKQKRELSYINECKGRMRCSFWPGRLHL